MTTQNCENTTQLLNPDYSNYSTHSFTMALALAAFPTFDTTDTSNLAPRWRKYVQRYENRATALSITNADRKLALLLDYAGEAVYDDFQTLVVPGPEANNPRDIYARSLEALNELYAPKVQVEYERFNFREATQLHDENLDQFITRLKKLAATCDFTNKDAEIKSQIIQKCKSSKLRTKALADITITLDQLVKDGKTMEKAISYAKTIEKKEVNAIQRGRGNYNNQAFQRRDNTRRDNTQRDNTQRDNSTRDDFRRGSSRGRSGNARGSRGRGRDSYNATRNATAECDYCGGPYPHEGGRSKCPAYNAECHQCGIVGHYAHKCRGGAPPSRMENSNRGRGRSNSHGNRGRGRRNVHNVEYGDEQSAEAPMSQQTPAQSQQRQNVHTLEDEENYIFTISTTKETVPLYSVRGKHTPKPMFMVEIDGNPVKMLGDTGAPVNIIGENAFYTLHPKLTLQPSDTTLYPYGKDRPPIALLGMFTATLSSDYAQDDTCVYVTKGNERALLSRDSAETLNLIKINRDAIVSEINTASPTPTQTCQEFQDLFTGIGKLKGVQLQLHIDKDVQPTAQPHRKEPFHLRSKIEAELKKLKDLGIIEDAVGSTPWVSNMVAAPKPKDPESVRICVDMRIANKAIEREHHPMPTVEEIIHDLNGATVFSKIYLNSGYHQIELHPDSRYITTFSTHTGLKRYKRLNFGICSAAEVFQYCIQTALAGLPGVRNFSDDIIVYGKTHEEHNANLHKVFERLRENGLTLNENKCEFGKSSLEFYGYKFSDKGMEIDPKKADKINAIQPPENPGELRSLLGMTNYCAKFIPDYATLT